MLYLLSNILSRQAFLHNNQSSRTLLATMAAPKVTKTRILIISDTHSTELNPEDDKRPFRKPLPKADVLLHCGDLTMIGHLEEYKKAIEMMRNIDAELKLVIAGNHDISLDKDYFEREGMRMHRQKWDRNCSEKALEMWKGDYAKSTGITYLEEGTYEFTISNGAKFSVCSHGLHACYTISTTAA